MKKLFKAVFSIIGIGFIGFVIMGIYGGNLQNNRKKWVEKNYERYFNSQKAYYDSLNNQNTIHFPNPVENLEDAKKIMETCMYQFDEVHCEYFIDGTLWIGEPKLWVMSTIGPYTSARNTTVVNGLTQEQWIYGDPLSGASYVYFNNDKLTSWQNFSNNY